MPEWGWYIIIPGGLVAASVLVVRMVVAGGAVRWGRGTLVVQGKRQNANGPLARSIDYVQRSTPAIRDLLFGVYLQLLIAAGGDPFRAAEYDDARFVKMLLAYLVNGGNGSNSIQKIVESEIVNADWHGRDLREYVRMEVWPPILRQAKWLIGSEYDTAVLSADGHMRTRWVPSKTFSDALATDEVRERIVDELVPLFEYTRRCLGDGCKG